MQKKFLVDFLATVELASFFASSHILRSAQFKFASPDVLRSKMFASLDVRPGIPDRALTPGQEM